MWNRFKTLDPWLYLIPLLLSIVSTVIIYSLTANTPANGSLYIRQAVISLVAMVLMVGVTFLDYRTLRGWANWFYLFGVLMLGLVRVFGKAELGAQRWIDIGFFQFQPGELEKIIIIIFLAALLSRYSGAVPWRRFVAIAILLLIPVAAVVVQPDLGTAIVIMCSGLGVLLASRITKSQNYAIAFFIAALAISFSLSFHNIKPFNKLLKDYQKNRLASFVDPKRDPYKSGYNVVQSVIAVGSGGLTGKGLGYGSQSQLNFLPVAHADFIFAGIAEAWGLVGSWGIIGLYGFLIFRLLQAARIAKDDFGVLLCLGIVVKITVEVLVNIGMNIQIMPVTGIPLPFLSYGGTTMLTNALAIGIVQSIVIRYKRLTF